MLTAIIDYESGNLHSAEKAFQRMAQELDAGEVVVTSDAETVARADRIVLPGDGAFPAWLFRIASFRCTDYLRRRRVHDEYDDEQNFAETDSNPEQSTLTTFANQQIAAALGTLPQDQRQVVELKFFQNFTFDDIAAQLGISPNTAKTRLYSALRKLKQHEELRDAL